MAVITRASLPEEFFDVTSAKLLTQPEPQYLYAQLAKMALGATFPTVGPMGIGIPGRDIGNQGVAYSSVDQDRLTISDGIFDEAVMFVADIGKAPGHTVRMNRPKFAGGGYTQASRAVPSATTISTTPIDLSSEQVAITIQRFAGPYDVANSRVAPYALDRFDASMSLHSLTSMVGKHMKRDFDKWLDQVLCTLYDGASTAIYAGSATALTDYTTPGDGPMDFEMLTRIEETMKTNNIQPFGNGQYVLVLHPRQGRQLKNDPQYTKLSAFHRDMNPLFQGFIGRVGKLDIFESNTLNTIASTTTVYNGHAFGPGMVGVGMGGMPGQIGPRLAFSTDDNYGEQAKVIWLAYLAFSILDNRFGVNVRTS